MMKGTRQCKNVLLPPLRPTHVLPHVMINPPFTNNNIPRCTLSFISNINPTHFLYKHNSKTKNTHTMYNSTMHKNHNLQAVWFAAGMAVIIACLERAVVVSIFKHLHMWVFLALNLLLIAILFTSKYPLQDFKNPSQKCDSSQDSCKKPPSPAPEVVEDHREAVVEDGVKGNEDMGFEEEDEGDDKTTTLLTNEELNERVEAFISRFRQEYLVSDVKVISRSRSDNVCVGTNRAAFEKTITV